MKVLITGASRGIGKAIATELGGRGHQLMLVSQNEVNLADTEALLRERFSTDVKSRRCDVGTESEVRDLARYCTEIGFLPNVLVLNAGIFIEGNLSEAPSNDFFETLRVNLYHIYFVVQQFLPFLEKQKNAKIVIIGSTASLEPYPVGALYGVSKWGLRGYAINLRKELMEKEIAVSLVNPGGTLTDLWEGEDLPPNRLLDPSDIGKLIAVTLELSPQAVVEEIVVRPMLGDFHE